jgi:hypothetical protein
MNGDGLRSKSEQSRGACPWLCCCTRLISAGKPNSQLTETVQVYAALLRLAAACCVRLQAP